MATPVTAQPGPTDVVGAPDGDPPDEPSVAASSPDAAPVGRRPRARPLMPRSLVMVVGTACAFLVLAGIHLTAWLVGPLFLALIIVIALSPVQSWLRGRGWAPWLTTLVLVLLVTGLVVLFVLVVVVSFARLAQLLPQYADQGNQLTKDVASSLQSFGVDQAQLQKAVSSINPSAVVGVLKSILSGLVGTATSLVLLLVLMLFISVEAGGMDRRLAAVAGDRPTIERALHLFAQGTRSYLVVTTVFGLIVGVLDGGALAIIGVPLPVLWGVLSFITNYIPNVGFVLGLIPPALLALLSGGVSEMLLVLAVYCALNFVIQSLIQPRFVGDSVGLSATMTIVALVFWAWLLGPLGALLSIPLTLLFKALLVDVDPTARWAIALAGSLERPPPEKGSKRRPSRAGSATIVATPAAADA